jgi:glycerol uptake facilitator-like aquaporin
VYAGIVINDRLQTNTAVNQACKKGKRIMNSLINIGIHDRGINPAISVKLWKTVVIVLEPPITPVPPPGGIFKAMIF